MLFGNLKCLRITNDKDIIARGYVTLFCYPPLDKEKEWQMSKSNPKGFYYVADKQLWKYSFSIEGKRHSVYGKTQKECRNKETEKRLLLKDHKHLDNQRITLNSYYQSWIEEHRNDVTESTIYAYSKSWKYIEKFLGKKRVVQIATEDVRSMRLFNGDR